MPDTCQRALEGSLGSISGTIEGIVKAHGEGGDLNEQTLGYATLRVIFVDNDNAHVKHYANVAQQIAASRGIPIRSFYIAEGRQLLAELERHSTDPTVLVFEPELATEKGLATLREIRARELNAQIILLSKSPAYALEGYEIDALAYLIKGGTTKEMFASAFNRALDRALVDSQQYITFSCAGFNQTLRLSDIEYFHVEKKIVTVYFDVEGGQKSFEFYSTLGKVSETLAGHGFIRAHRNFVVSIPKIVRYENDTITLESGKTVPVGRNFRKDVASAMKLVDG